MKQYTSKIIFFLFVFFSSALIAQKNIYESPKFDALTSHHKTLAIIPFLTHLKLDAVTSKEEMATLEEKEGYAVQDALETYFSKRKKKKKLAIAFQNIKNTNALLAQNNITYKNIDIYTAKQLCKILNVQGIVGGTLDLNVLLSKGVATDFSFTDYFSGNANYGRIGVKISDGSTGKLLWKYEKKISKKTGKNTNDLVDKMMKAASRKFPYDRERKKK